LYAWVGDSKLDLVFKFQTLEVWRKAVELADLLIGISEDLPQKYQYSFGDQLRRAGLSIPSNIAEGNGRRTHKDSRNLYGVSRGSLYESVNILVVLSKRGLVDWKKHNKEKIYLLAEDIVRMLSGLMRNKGEED
jgi:four helix bundle protein